jgi:hypothetical protein
MSSEEPMRRGRPPLSIVACALLACLSIWASGPYVKGMEWHYHENNLVVSFGVGEALDQADMRETIMSTRPVSFTFTVEVIKHRTLWKNRVVARKVVVRTVRYDNLTRQFSLDTTINGEQTDQRVVDSWEEMAQYLETVKDLSVTSVANLLPSEGSYTVRARVHVLSDFVLWIIPWDVQTPWVSQPLSTP